MKDLMESLQNLEDKKNHLMEQLHGYGSVAVAFSGGVDSTLLLAAARRVLPREHVFAVTAVSPSLAEGQQERCRSLAVLLDAQWQTVETQEFDNPQYRSNPPDRCYFCKSDLYAKIIPLAREGGYCVVVNGLNLDDLSDIRPGQKAAVEAGVQSPLRDAQLTKPEIRALSRFWNLPTWNDPEMPCLSSRVSFGNSVEPELLRKVDRAERAIRNLGFQVVRVRTNGTDARVEVGKDSLPAAFDRTMNHAICRVVRDAGFHEVVVDPNGYERGSLHRVSGIA